MARKRSREVRDVRVLAGPGAYLQDPPGRSGMVGTVRSAIERTRATDPGASPDALAQAAERALARAGYRKAPKPEALKRLIERLR